MNKISRILITPGEPAGVGPDIVLMAAQKDWPCELVVIGDPLLLEKRAQSLGLDLALVECHLQNKPKAHSGKTLSYIPVELSHPAKPGILDVLNASYVTTTLEIATNICLQKDASAIVTGPVNKEIINAAGVPFSGHTEFFAKLANVQKTVMLFVVDQMKVALVTTHLPLAYVPAAITEKLLMETIMIVHHDMQRLFRIDKPRIKVTGLNPHAGEGGYLGREEIDIIAPAIARIKEHGIEVIGPKPADTIFTQKELEDTDVVLAMYHDQALPVVKYVGFDRAVNVTLGLPFIRTSVDHGTALDIAGTNKVDSGSMLAAIQLAIELSANGI